MADRLRTLAGERTLLVIDNCEHVVDSAAELVDILTAECPQLSVIVHEP